MANIDENNEIINNKERIEYNNPIIVYNIIDFLIIVVIHTTCN